MYTFKPNNNLQQTNKYSNGEIHYFESEVFLSRMLKNLSNTTL